MTEQGGGEEGEHILPALLAHPFAPRVGAQPLQKARAPAPKPHLHKAALEAGLLELRGCGPADRTPALPCMLSCFRPPHHIGGAVALEEGLSECSAARAVIVGHREAQTPQNKQYSHQPGLSPEVCSGAIALSRQCPGRSLLRPRRTWAQGGGRALGSGFTTPVPLPPVMLAGAT